MHVAFPCAQMSRHKNKKKLSISSGGIKDPADKEAQFFCTRCRRRRKFQSLPEIKRQSSNPQSSALLSYHDRLFLHSGPRRRMSATYVLTNSYVATTWRAVVSCRLHQFYFPAKWLSKMGPNGCPETSVRNYHCEVHPITGHEGPEVE
jgi:hypothetical protein